MHLYRVFGAITLILSGYIAHAVISSDWQLQGKAIVFVFILFMAYIGLAAVLSSNTKSFKENFRHGLSILSLLP